jgi:hypothetical protein
MWRMMQIGLGLVLGIVALVAFFLKDWQVTIDF